MINSDFISKTVLKRQFLSEVDAFFSRYTIYSKSRSVKCHWLTAVECKCIMRKVHTVFTICKAAIGLVILWFIAFSLFEKVHAVFSNRRQLLCQRTVNSGSILPIASVVTQPLLLLSSSLEMETQHYYIIRNHQKLHRITSHVYRLEKHN